MNRNGFGDIEFAKKRLKSAFNYFRKGSAEEAIFEALPDVLENGIEISKHSYHKGRDYGTVTIAAPVIVNGKRGNMAVVVKQTTANYYKVHRILSLDGSVFVLSETTEEAEPTSGGGVTQKDPLATPIGSASIDTIQNHGKNVKQRFSYEEKNDNNTGTGNLEKDMPDEMRNHAQRVSAETGMPVTFVIGKMNVRGKSGKVAQVRGAIAGGQIYVQADNTKVSAGKIADHEIFHAKADTTQGLVSQIHNKITEQYSREQMEKVLDKYIDAMYGIIDMEADPEEGLRRIEEEIFADAYAGINAYDVTHAASGRQKRGKQVDTKSQGINPSMLASKINIADLLQSVKSTYRSILSEDVLNKMGEKKNDDGYYTGRVRFSYDGENADADSTTGNM